MTEIAPAADLVIESGLINVVGTILTIVWGAAAMWLVWGCSRCCPVRWPMLFGTTSMGIYLTLNDPRWVPSVVTDDHVALCILGVGIVVAIGLLVLIIERYELEPPQGQLRALLHRL